MATIEELWRGLYAADAAGNTADAKVFADEIRRIRAQQSSAQTSSEPSRPVITTKELERVFVLAHQAGNTEDAQVFANEIRRRRAELNGGQHSEVSRFSIRGTTPNFTVTEITSGRTLNLTGDSPPSEAELNEIFATPGLPFKYAEQPDLFGLKSISPAEGHSSSILWGRVSLTAIIIGVFALIVWRKFLRTAQQRESAWNLAVSLVSFALVIGGVVLAWKLLAWLGDTGSSGSLDWYDGRRP